MHIGGHSRLIVGGVIIGIGSPLILSNVHDLDFRPIL